MFWRKRGLTDFSEEVKAHLELETERLKAQGLSEAEAREGLELLNKTALQMEAQKAAAQ